MHSTFNYVLAKPLFSWFTNPINNNKFPYISITKYALNLPQMLHEKLNLPKCNLVYLIQSCFFFPCRLDKASATSRRNSGLFRMGSSYRYRYNSCLMDIYGNSWKHYLFICFIIGFYLFLSLE